MEGVDDIILHTLRRLGCDIDDEMFSLKQLTTELVVEATVKCLRQITPDFRCSEMMPLAMSARFRLGMALAQACTDIGYSNEIGYQTFLYWNDTDIRTVFMFLLEKLPRDLEKGVPEPLGEMTLLYDQISKYIHHQLHTPWSPLTLCNWETVKCPLELKSYHGQKFHSVPIQTNHSTIFEETRLITDLPSNHWDVCPSLIEFNMSSITAAQEKDRLYREKLMLRQTPQAIKQDFHSREKIKAAIRQEMAQGAVNVEERGKVLNLTLGKTGSKISEGLQQSSSNSLADETADSNVTMQANQTQEDIDKSRETEVDMLNKDLEQAEKLLKEALLDTRKLSASSQQMERHLSQLQSNYLTLRDSYTMKKTTFELLPEVDTNMAKLQAVIEASSQRLVSLLTQWEKHRAPLIEQYRQLKEDSVDKLSETRRKIDEIKLLREKMKEITTEAHTKDSTYTQLVKDHEKLAKDMNRSTYTHRIMEIIGNIKKQKLDIEKVLIDTKAVQKEINQLSGKLERTFTVTDELIFKDAKKDEAVRKTYKYLAALHENCSQLVKIVEETGTIMREIRDLEDQIENESHKKVLANLERITADYNQMKQENATLMTKFQEN